MALMSESHQREAAIFDAAMERAPELCGLLRSPVASASDGARGRERARHDVVSRQLVQHVDQHGLGADAEDGSLHRAHVVVLQPEVGHERDQGRHSAILAARPTSRTVA